ncbi:hypothetical protein TRFO_08499 [Tritrichomonas foetus]|uniref:Uncharacterized protein n=1 Tax=Tritrichomonas foetus TaxID=1144522 RepID=A0A1J4JP06_9EUKA|nr:hypothetical protein TRFO_08499 [Tritrichomonas foetus]|eukprot:OHS99251.1 hypothetical protein TRFO_08499 [Tritrichomonas foetus]
MTIRELDGSAQSMINEEHLECLNQITDTKRHLNELIEKTNGYSKNSGTSFRDNVSPKTRKKKEYRKSPYGQKLHISDYSTLCSSRRLKM